MAAELGLTLVLEATGLRARLHDLDTNGLLASGSIAPDRLPDIPPEVAEAIADFMGRGTVRLWLRPAPGMRDLPWETLCRPELGGIPLALTPGLRLVHESFYSGPPPRPPVSLNPRILVASANPSTGTYPPLASAANEIHSVVAALNAAEVRRCHSETLSSATPKSLAAALSRWKPDVFHFVGHADVDDQGGFLVLEGYPGKVYGLELGSLLRRAGTRMAVLSGCLTASGSDSISEALITQGLECVIGMRGPLEDGASHLFARALYASLAEGAAVDEAVWQGRKAVSGSVGDWATPVLIARRPLAPLFLPERKRHRTNILGDMRPFIGRTSEKAEVRRALSDRKRRFITVHGLGGMGKTRLCREVARESFGHFDSVWIIDCEPIVDAEELFLSIAATLKIKVAGDSEAAVADAIGESRILILLDGLDHASAGLVSRVDTLLDRCPNLKILSSSIEQVDSKYARRIELGPMAFPARGRSEAMRLFLQAASQSAPGFRLHDGDRAIVQRLLASLDGIPLAIVLVASRLAYLDVRTVANLVQSDVYDVASDPNLTGRHAALGRALESSINSLTDEERTLIRDLSIFRGGFTFDDAAEVLGDAFALLNGLALLRRRGLISVQSTSSEHRYRILDTVRTYLEKVVNIEPSPESRLRHAEYYANHALSVRKCLDSGEWESGNARLWSENANYDAALNLAAEFDAFRIIGKFAQALARPYYEAGAMNEFERLAAMCEKSDDDNLRIEIDGLRGSHARRSGKPTEALEIWLLRAERCLGAGRFDDYGDSLLDCANLALELGEVNQAESLLLSFRSHSQKYGPLVLASGLLVQARLVLCGNEIETASYIAAEAEKLAEDVATHPQAPFIWRSLAEVYRKLGDLPRSERMARRLISDALTAGYYQSTGTGLLELSETLEAMGQFDATAEALAVVCAIPRTVSSSLHDAAKTRYRYFAKKHGRFLFDGPDDALRESIWTVLAAKIGDRTSDPERGGI